MKIALLLAALTPILVGEELQFNWKEHPSLKFGKAVKIDFRYKFQSDFRSFGEGVESDEGVHEFHRQRIGIEGKLFKRVEFEMEREMRDPENPWRDVFVNVRVNRAFEIKGGKFKVPFSMDQLTSPTKSDFIYRSRAGTLLAPGRDIGVMVHGRLLGRALRYETGLFRQDGDNSQGGDLTVAGRVRTEWKNALAGLSFTRSDVEEGENSLRGKTISGEKFFHRIYVNGTRLRLGVEGKWTAGPVTIKGEYIRVRDQRLGPGLTGGDLPDLVARGWYLTGVWRIGRFDLAARHDALSFSSPGGVGRLSRTPRAANVLGNRDNVWTVGGTWRVNRWFEVQSNLVHESLTDPVRTPIPGQSGFWSKLCRLQFVM